MYLIRKKTSLSFPEIGSLFGGRDHSTVIYSINKVENLTKKNFSVKDHVDALCKKI
jgi:chromosomal replication initiator protein